MFWGLMAAVFMILSHLLHCAFGDNSKDGLLVLPEVQTTPNDPGTTIGIRLLHTDSGHYLVPVTTDNDAAPTLYNSLAAKIYKRLKPLLPNGSLSNGGRSESVY